MEVPTAERPVLQRAVQGEHAQVEHVARGMRLGARVEEQPPPFAAREGGRARALDVRDGVLKRRRAVVARRGALGVDADGVRAEVLAQELGGEQGHVREPVGLLGERGVRAHGEREWLVLLDEVQEPLAPDGPDRLRGDVGAPPGRGDEAVRPADVDSSCLASEHDLDAIEEPLQALVRLEIALPGPRQRGHGVHGDDPDADAALGEAACEVELADVAPEEVL